MRDGLSNADSSESKEDNEIRENFIIHHESHEYEVDDVVYSSSSTHRRFKRGGELVLSVPLNSVLIRKDSGVVSRVKTNNYINVNPSNPW